MTNAGALKSALGIQSTRMVESVLGMWRRRLTAKERIFLANYRKGAESNPEDPFPDLHLTPQIGDNCGPLLKKAKDFNLRRRQQKTIYFNCVRVMCKRGLNNRPLCVWSSRLGGDEAVPCWRVLFKSLITKGTADLLWRILHGSIACNAIVCVFNPLVPAHSVVAVKQFFIVLASVRDVREVPHSF